MGESARDRSLRAQGFALAWAALPDETPEAIADAIADAAIASCGEVARKALREKGWSGRAVDGGDHG